MKNSTPAEKNTRAAHRRTAETQIFQAICIGLFVAAVLVYLPSFSFGYVNYDDPDYVSQNPHVLAGLSLRRIAWAFLIVHASNWHPLTWISHMLDATLFGPGAGGPHMVNIFLHAANTVLIFLVLQKMTGARWRSAMVAALFALHPLHVESVSWISERKDVLSTFFGLLTLWSYAGYVKDARAGNPQKRKYWWALFFYGLALLSKPMVVTLPCAMLLLDYWPLQRMETDTFKRLFSSLLRLVKEKWPFFVGSLIACLLTLRAQTPSEAPMAAVPLSSRIENVFIAYAMYLAKTFWPANLACLYLHPGSWPLPEVLVCAVIVVAISVAIFRLRKKYPFALFGWLWYLGLLIPVIGLVQVGYQYMADRYTYMPLVGIFIIIIWGCGEAVTRWRKLLVPGYVVGALILATCCALTWRQQDYWSSGEKLFKHAVELAATKGNYVAYNNLGAYLVHQKAYNPAVVNFKKALEIKPDFKRASKNLGIALIAAKRYEEAIDAYQIMLRQYPPDVEMYCNLGFSLTASGRLDEAVVAYNKALELKPDIEEVLVNMAGIYTVEGKYREAADLYEKILVKSPKDFQVLYGLGNARLNLGETKEAAEAFRKAIAIYPNYTEAKEALQKLEAPVEKPVP